MNRPIGTVTFLFTDVEGSTRAWEAHPAETQTALKRHDEIVAREIEAHNGALILERGEGDSVFAVFARAADAVSAAVEIQRALHAQTWPVDVPMRVRMAIHTGEAGADYRGPHVNRAARLRAIAHGEQILISGVTAGILRDALPAGASLVDLAPLSGAGLVIDAIAAALKIEAGLSAIDALVRALEGTQTLIILDNCEHLLAE